MGFPLLNHFVSIVASLELGLTQNRLSNNFMPLNCGFSPMEEDGDVSPRESVLCQDDEGILIACPKSLLSGLL